MPKFLQNKLLCQNSYKTSGDIPILFNIKDYSFTSTVAHSTQFNQNLLCNPMNINQTGFSMTTPLEPSTTAIWF